MERAAHRFLPQALREDNCHQSLAEFGLFSASGACIIAQLTRRFMNNSKTLLGISAFAVVGLGVALAFTIIAGIWGDFRGEVIGKLIATLFVLFVLATVLHSVAKGMCDKPKDKL